MDVDRIDNHIVAITSLAVVLGGVLRWLLVNERRMASLEEGRRENASGISEIKDAIAAVHERLDAFFTGRDRKKERD